MLLVRVLTNSAALQLQMLVSHHMKRFGSVSEFQIAGLDLLGTQLVKKDEHRVESTETEPELKEVRL